MVTLQVTARTGFFPDRQAQARGAPGLHHLAVGPRARADPFQQVENQGFDGGVARRWRACQHLGIDHVDRLPAAQALYGMLREQATLA